MKSKKEALIMNPVFPRNFNQDIPYVSHGEGIYLFDESGNRYIDAASGALSVNIGYGVPEVIEVSGSRPLRSFRSWIGMAECYSRKPPLKCGIAPSEWTNYRNSKERWRPLSKCPAILLEHAWVPNT